MTIWFPLEAKRDEAAKAAKGERVTITTKKSNRGFGLTVEPNEGDDIDEAIEILCRIADDHNATHED
ncbi:MAG TPA: hypothetical protein VFQ61_06425 [Polyangiaceae bacterium]|nr:hypothetical protein [Polyangiaceae bacterium]